MPYLGRLNMQLIYAIATNYTEKYRRHKNLANTIYKTPLLENKPSLTTQPSTHAPS